VVTSCGRQDLLEETLDSFFAHNTYPLTKHIVIEDSERPGINDALQRKYRERSILWLQNDARRGQLRSIDIAYAYANTEFIFHCEDDWRFFSPGFMERSISVLDADPAILQVWLRRLDDTNTHPVLPDAHATPDGVPYRLLAVDYGPWSGFSFNPGLRRRRDYERVAPYERIGSEWALSICYRQLGYMAAILLHPAVEHIGWGRHVE
jgi:hypothetical protein